MELKHQTKSTGRCCQRRFDCREGITADARADGEEQREVSAAPKTLNTRDAHGGIKSTTSYNVPL